MNANSLPSSAVIVIAHGSSDPQWRQPFDALVDLLRLRAPGTRFELAFLSRGEPDVVSVARMLIAEGFLDLHLAVALMSGGGGHFKTDLPEIVKQVHNQHPAVRITLVPEALGCAPEVISALADACLRATIGTR